MNGLMNPSKRTWSRGEGSPGAGATRHGGTALPGSSR